MIESIKEYVQNLKTPIVKAEKSGCILARIGVEGEKIETFVEIWTLETVNTVKNDEEGNLGIVVTIAILLKKIKIDNFLLEFKKITPTFKSLVIQYNFHIKS